MSEIDEHQQNKQMQSNVPIFWEKTIPWLITATSYITIAFIAAFLVNNVFSIRETLLPKGEIVLGDYINSRMNIYIFVLLKSVGVFSALCLIFIGLSVSLFVSINQIKLGIGFNNGKVSLLTHSPGIIAVLLGVVLMIAVLTVNLNNDFYQTKPETQISNTIERTMSLQ
jgi:hypothetical protein